MKKAKGLWMACGVLLLTKMSMGQTTLPENGVADPRHGQYAFTHATIVKDANTTLSNATLLIKDGKITAVVTNVQVPPSAVEINCTGKYLYPSFIDIYAEYGTTIPQRQAGG